MRRGHHAARAPPRTPCSSSTTARPTTRRSTSGAPERPCLRLPVNAGKGAALKAGIEEVLKGRQGQLGDTFDYILTVDGDGQHDPATSRASSSLAVREHADFVIGVRNVRVMPPKSKIGNYFSRLVFFLGTGRYVPDTQSGFRLFSRLAGRSAAHGGLVAALRDRGRDPDQSRVARIHRRDRRDPDHLLRSESPHAFRSAVGLDARRRRAEPLRAVVARSHGGRLQRLRAPPALTCRATSSRANVLARGVRGRRALRA